MKTMLCYWEYFWEYYWWNLSLLLFVEKKWVSFVEWKHTNNCCQIIILIIVSATTKLSTRHPGRWAPHNASNVIVQLNSDSDRDTEFILSRFWWKMVKNVINNNRKLHISHISPGTFHQTLAQSGMLLVHEHFSKNVAPELNLPS